MLITSLDNPKIKKYLKLKQKKYRDIYQLFLIEGEHLVKEAIKSNLLVDLFILENEDLSFDFNCTYVSFNIMKKLSSMESVPKVIGVVSFLKEKEITGNKVLLLDDIQDPGNLGTILRSSLAFDVYDIVLNLNSVDLYNEKVIRSSQGMLFQLNVIRRDLKELINILKQNDYEILSTNVNDGVNPATIKSSKFALIMGNEGNGVKEEIQELADKNLKIDMNSKVESLNVGVATSILLYELNR